MPAAKKPAPRTARQGPRMYLDILRLIKTGRANTSLSICAAQGIGKTTAYRIAMAMWGCGLIHPCGWELHGSHWVAVWKHGDAPAAPHPNKGTMTAPRCTRIEMLAFANWWRELQAPSSLHDLAEASGYAVGPLRMLVVHARARRMVRVADWLLNMGTGGDHTALYQQGSKPDEPKPAPQCKKLLDRQYWERRRERLQQQRLYAATAGAVLRRQSEPANDQLEAA